MMSDYDIGGLYYQPMISYCMARENGGRRMIVDVPDRMMSDYDKRSYKLKDEECDYEDFLVKCYQRRIKDNNLTKIQCARVSRSEKNTELGMLRGAAVMRDKYLNQVQLMYTEKLAKGGKMKGMIVENREDGRARRSESVEISESSAGVENKMLALKRNDARYGPAYEKVTVLDSERYNRGEDVDFVNPRSTRAKAVDRTAVEESSKMEKVSSSKMMMMSNAYGENAEEASEYKRRSFVNKDFLAADTMKEFIDVRRNEMMNKEDIPVKPAAQPYIDTTYSKAMYDVKRRIKKEGDKLWPTKTQIEDIKFNFRGRTIDEIGSFEKSVIRSEMYKKPILPDFDIGYDAI